MRSAAAIFTPAIRAALGTAVLGVILAAVVGWSTPAKANQIDLSTWTCKQFQSANRDEVTLILAWLDGYYRAEDDPPIVDTDQLSANAKKLGAYCATHPDTKLIGAADALFERE
jgi:acid stress chaperone HdeB